MEGRGQSPEARGAAGSPGSHHCCRARVVQPPTANPALVLAGQIVPGSSCTTKTQPTGARDSPVASQATARSCHEHQVDHCASWCRHSRLKIAGGTSSAAWDLTPVALGQICAEQRRLQRPVLHTHPLTPLFVRVPGPSARAWCVCVCARPRLERRHMQRGEGDSAGPMSFSTKK